MTVRIGAAGHPRYGQSLSGDAWSIRWFDDTCRIALIDGAGHGSAAAAASAAALGVLDGDPSLDPAHLLTLCHRSLTRSRGAVMTIAVVRPGGNLTLAGVGNIEAHLLAAGREQHLVTQRGMLGANLPRVRPIELSLEGHWRLVLHTDGVSARFTLRDPDLHEHARTCPDALAQAILQHHARPHDDAAVVAIFNDSESPTPALPAPLAEPRA